MEHRFYRHIKRTFCGNRSTAPWYHRDYPPHTLSNRIDQLSELVVLRCVAVPERSFVICSNWDLVDCKKVKSRWSDKTSCRTCIWDGRGSVGRTFSRDVPIPVCPETVRGDRAGRLAGLQRRMVNRQKSTFRRKMNIEATHAHLGYCLPVVLRQLRVRSEGGRQRVRALDSAQVLLPDFHHQILLRFLQKVRLNNN